MAREPIQLYRLRCGRRIWSPWLTEQHAAWRLAAREGLAHKDERLKRTMPGPLVWIERGQQQYAGRKVEPLEAQPNGMPLPPINRPPWPLD